MAEFEHVVLVIGMRDELGRHRLVLERGRQNEGRGGPLLLHPVDDERKVAVASEENQVGGLTKNDVLENAYRDGGVDAAGLHFGLLAAIAPLALVGKGLHVKVGALQKHGGGFVQPLLRIALVAVQCRRAKHALVDEMQVVLALKGRHQREPVDLAALAALVDPGPIANENRAVRRGAGRGRRRSGGGVRNVRHRVSKMNGTLALQCQRNQEKTLGLKFLRKKSTVTVKAPVQSRKKKTAIEARSTVSTTEI